MTTVRLTRRYTICCAHQLRGLGPTHKCSRKHGHNYTIDLSFACAQEGLDNGMVIEGGVVDVHVGRIIKALDHCDLNEFNDGTTFGERMALQPTAENLALYLWERLLFLRIEPDKRPGEARRGRLVEVRVRETDDLWAEVTG